MSETAALATVQKRVIIFDEHGQPQLAVQPVLTQQHIRSLYAIVAAQPYVVDDPLDLDFGKYDGMTVAEVMVRKQIEGAAKSGDMGQIETVMDRLIGKALARSENLNLSAGYEEWLRRKEAEMAAAPINADVVGVRDPHPTDSQGNFDDNEIEVFGDLA